MQGHDCSGCMQVEPATYRISTEAIAAMPGVRGGNIARLKRTRAVASAQILNCRAAFQKALGDVSGNARENVLHATVHLEAASAEALRLPSPSADEPPEQPYAAEPAHAQPESPHWPTHLVAIDAEMGQAEQREPSAVSPLAAVAGSSGSGAAVLPQNGADSSPSHEVDLMRAQPEEATASAQGFVWYRNSCGPDFLSMALAGCWRELGGSAHVDQPLGALLSRMEGSFTAARADSRLQRSLLDLVYTKYASLIDRAWSPGCFTGMPTLVEGFGALLGNIHEAHAIVHGECLRCGAQEARPRTFQYISLLRIPRCALDLSRHCKGQMYNSKEVMASRGNLHVMYSEADGGCHYSITMAT